MLDHDIILPNHVGNYQDYDIICAQEPLQQLQPVQMDASGRTECLVGTRADVLGSILQWVNDPSKKTSVFWLTGCGGVGKSVVATTIANECRSLGRLGAFLFFDQDVIRGNDPGAVIRTISYQMGSYNPRLGAIITTAIDDFPNGISRAPQEQFRKFIVEPLFAAQQHTTPDSKSGRNLDNNMPVVIVIDALDECGNPGSREDLLAVLSKETAALASVLRVIVTSPAISDIRDAFGGRDHIIPYELNTASDINIADIQLFLQHRANEIRNSSKYLGLPEDWPGEAVIQTLTLHACGLFVWAEIAARFIHGHYPQRRLEVLLKAQAAPTAAAALKSMYEMVLESTGDWKDDCLAADFHKIMGVVIAAKIPLSCMAIDQILRLSPDQSALRTVSRLRCFMSQSPTVRVFHRSFTEFLSTRSQCGRDIWFIDPVAHNQALAIRCLELLNGSLTENICNLTLSPRLGIMALPEALGYACKHWIDHVYDVKTYSRQVLVLLDTFLNRHLLHWFEAMSILRRSRDTVALLDKLLAWITSNPSFQSGLFGLFQNAWGVMLGNLFGYTMTKLPDQTSLLELVTDARRFAQTFARSMMQHPLLVYVGALPLAPISSVLYQKYHDSARFPSVSGGFLQSFPMSTSIPTGHESSPTPLFSPDGSHTISDHASLIRDQCSIQFSSADDKSEAQISRRSVEADGSQTNWITAVAISPDGKRVVSGSHNSTISLWDVETGRAITTFFQAHTDRITSIAFSPNSSRVASGSHDGQIHFWDVDAGKAMGGPRGSHTDMVTSIAFSPDGRRVASGSRDRTVRVWDLALQTTIPFQGHMDWVTSVAFLLDGQQVASASKDRTVRVWDVNTGQTTSGPFECRKDFVQPVAFLDGTRHSCGTSDLGWDATSDVQPSADVALEHILNAFRSPDSIEVDRGGWLIYLPSKKVISKLPHMITPLCSASNEKSIVIGASGGEVVIINFPEVAL